MQKIWILDKIKRRNLNEFAEKKGNAFVQEGIGGVANDTVNVEPDFAYFHAQRGKCAGKFRYEIFILD